MKYPEQQRRDCPLDPEGTIKWLGYYAERGETWAMRELTNWLFKGHDYVKGMNWLCRLAETNNPDGRAARREIYKRLLDGLDCPADPKKAKKWLLHCVKREEVWALSELADQHP